MMRGNLIKYKLIEVVPGETERKEPLVWGYCETEYGAQEYRQYLIDRWPEGSYERECKEEWLIIKKCIALEVE